jgi:hypothetical protein
MYLCFFYGKTFFPDFYRFRNTCERSETHYLENCLVKILVLEFESKNGKQNFWILIGKKWIRIQITGSALGGNTVIRYRYLTGTGTHAHTVP